MTPFLIAVSMNDTDRVRQFLQEGADVNQSWPDGVTGIHVAAQNGFLELGEILLKYTANIRHTDNSGFNSLLYACLANQPDFIRYLLETAYDTNPESSHPTNEDNIDIAQKKEVLNSATTDGSTSLAVASRAGHYGCVQILLEHQADVDIANTGGLQALHQACVGNHADIIELLLQYGADLNVYTKEDEPPCRLTTSRECHEVLHKWIEGNKMDWQSQYGFMKGVNEPIYYINCSS